MMFGMKIIIPNGTLEKVPFTNQVKTIIFMTNEFEEFIPPLFWIFWWDTLSLIIVKPIRLTYHPNF